MKTHTLLTLLSVFVVTPLGCGLEESTAEFDSDELLLGPAPDEPIIHDGVMLAPRTEQSPPGLAELECPSELPGEDLDGFRSGGGCWITLEWCKSPDHGVPVCSHAGDCTLEQMWDICDALINKVCGGIE